MNKIAKLFWRLVYFNQPVKYARKKGVTIGTGNSFVDHPCFASEPYLVRFGDNNRVSFDVTFITHDGGGGFLIICIQMSNLLSNLDASRLGTIILLALIALSIPMS